MNAVKETLADWRDGLFDLLPDTRPVRWGVLALVVYLLVATITGIFWSLTPDHFDPEEKAAQYATEDGGEVVTGSVTTAALMGVMETLLEKPGGYLHNDRFPPGIWLDNMPNWEYGVLIQVRDLSRAMREVFSRSQSQSTEDEDLAMAEPRYHFDSDSWVLPSSESEYQQAQDFTRKYFSRLSDADAPGAQFYARADNLRYWLSTVNTRLGSLSQRLSASVGQRRLNTDLAGDAGASQSTQGPVEMEVKTPWLEIDDVFYEARGTTWALIHFLRAIEADFADVLEKKNALVSLRQIIRELEGAQETVWSPMILNGTGFGLVANHSLVMASYISRANAAIIDLRDLLLQG
ncbi:DUF2333 family protein [Pseudohalioglobus lutimaris]|uniref:DUF2333 domain-containing protein n=1 Tax=Pseudohalioglobus lutimaris TaxID=1737061 RepID=A0A2N5X174_9GAMM|nr:DUF2333 family protein [Pseudohalioglobus lutimaris]PLW68232.1 DUF2333 domain-containing protein [Pseudohalioglobus lutimaris]